jgi:hypothetical protein
MKIKQKNQFQWLRLITDIANECDMSAKQVVAFESVLQKHLKDSEGLEVVYDYDATWRTWVATKDGFWA